MAGFASMIAAFRRVEKEIDRIGEIAKSRSAGARPSTPEKFAVYRDPNGRFELRYPKGWELDPGEGVTVRSKRISTFANVEVMAGTETPWKELEEALKKLGGSLEITKRLPGPPKHARGKLVLGPTRFAMNAWSWERGSELVVLITANVIDSERSKKIEQYEDKVLEAIRREFKVG